ncbi:MAG: heme-binding protein [Alphaproteobacteria bacterium]|nr:heme-binding protein [Alphaproteobacteria bacterium]
MKAKKSYILYGTFVLFLFLLAMSGTIMSQVNEPKFKVIESHGKMEIREYAPLLVAQVMVEGERKEAISKGFRMLADYIFGNNAPRQKISMTAPVTQQQGEKIAMTTPVIQQASNHSGHWKVRFVMPGEYTLETLPHPNNSQIELLSIPTKHYAVIMFSGLASQESLQRHLGELVKYAKETNLKTLGEPIFAFYNPPWTLPFLRRNEVMMEVKE